MSMNLVVLQGNLGRNPEIRYYPDGTPNASFSVATNDRWRDKKTGALVERTEWHRCVANARLAQIAGEYLLEGDPILIEGKNRTRKWVDKQGVDRYTAEVIVTRLTLLSSGKGKYSEPPIPESPPLDEDSDLEA